MKKMKWILAAAMLLVAVPAMAQDSTSMVRDPRAMERRQNDVLFKDITLSAEQTVRVDSIQTASREAHRALMMTGAGAQDSTMRSQMSDLRQKMMNDVRVVLTTEQQLVFDKNRLTLAAQMPAGRRPPQR